MKKIILPILLSILLFSTAAVLSTETFTVSSLNADKDQFVTLTIRIDAKGIAKVSKESRPAQTDDDELISIIGLPNDVFKFDGDSSMSFTLPKSKTHALWAVKIDLSEAPSKEDMNRTGGWVFVWAKKVKYE